VFIESVFIKIFIIRSQQISESYGIQPINEWVERKRRREWNEHVARMGVERLVKIFRNNVPEERIPGGPERSSDLIKTGELAYNKVEDWSPSFFSYSLKVLIPILFIFCFFARFIDHEEILKYTNRIEWF
jgi:hypothetical protein